MFVFVSFGLVFTGIAALRSYLCSYQTPTAETLDETQFPIVNETEQAPDPSEETKRRLKAQRYRMAEALTSNPHFKVAASVHHWPENFSAVPIAESTTVLVGEVITAKGQLAADRTAVYSDFAINPVQILRDTINIVKLGETVTASRYGGRVRFRDGNTLLVFQSDLGMPRTGRRYVFFLRATDADFELVTAYELRAGKVLPLDGGTPNFSTYENWDEKVFIQEVQQKIEAVQK